MNLEYILNWHQSYGINIYITLIIIICYVVARKYLKPRIEKSIQHSRLNDNSFKIASHSANIILGLISVAAICIVWGFDFRGLIVLSTGILTITGVALFASWSILSNITAFFLLIVHKSFSQGTFIRVVDGDNFIEGYISEINLFNTKLLTEDQEVIIYPNNLLISRPTIINPGIKSSTIGKITELAGNNKLKNIDDN